MAEKLNVQDEINKYYDGGKAHKIYEIKSVFNQLIDNSAFKNDFIDRKNKITGINEKVKVTDIPILIGETMEMYSKLSSYKGLQLSGEISENNSIYVSYGIILNYLNEKESHFFLQCPLDVFNTYFSAFRYMMVLKCTKIKN